jgi:hypothetical protein
MTAAQYFVMRQDEEWAIRFRDELFGPYKSKNEALLFAIDAAQAIGEREHAAQVLVEDEPNRFITFWSYGDPVHPPVA